MNIEWTLCSERIPPDDRDSIVKNYDGSFIHVVASKAHSFTVDYLLKNFACEWTEYTQEKWEFLNR